MNLKKLINERIGIDLFQEKLDMIRKSTWFISASRNRSPSDDMTLDYSFTCLFNYSCGLIKKLFK